MATVYTHAFESGNADGWSNVVGYRDVINGGTGHSGTGFVVIVSGILARSISGLVPGQQYTFSAWFKTYVAGGSTIGLGIDGMSDYKVYASGNATWTQLAINFTATATSHSFRLIGQSNQDTNVDDVLLVDGVTPGSTTVAPFPDPTDPTVFWDDFDDGSLGSGYTVVGHPANSGVGTNDGPGTITTVDGRTGSPSHYMFVGSTTINQTSSVSKTVQIGSGGGTVEFWARRESESGYDFNKFFIDGVQQYSVSGTYGWLKFSYPLTAGNHTFKWEFTSDSSAWNGISSQRIAALTVTGLWVNTPPSVNAGIDTSVTLGSGVALDATVSDVDADSLTVTWTKVSGPGTVVFGDANAVDTTATFSKDGYYVLRLTANDGTATAFDDVAVSVLAPPPVRPVDVVTLEVNNGSWLDITGPVTNISMSRTDGDVATLSAEVLDAALDPIDVDTLRPGRPVRLLVNDDPEFVGVLDTIQVDYDPLAKGSKTANIKFTAVDAVSTLANKPQAITVGPIEQLRNTVSGVPFNFNGVTTAGGTSTTISKNENSSVWDQVLLTRDINNGYAWVSKDGTLFVADSAHATATGTDMDPDLYTDLNMDFTLDEVINSVTVNWLRYDIGPETSTSWPYGPYENGASIAEWGRRSYAVTLAGPVEEESIIEDYAQAILDSRSTPTHTPKFATIRVNDDAKVAAVQSYDLNTLVEVYNTDGTTHQTMRIDSIEYTITAGVWTATYGLKVPGRVSDPSTQPGTGISPIPDGSIGEDELDPDVIDRIVGAEEMADDALTAASEAFDEANAAILKLDGWTYTGTTSIDGGVIRTDTIGAVQIGANAITSKHTLTGPLIQTTATANRGIKLNSTGLIGYSNTGVTNFYIDATTGAATFRGEILSGSTITGANLVGTTSVSSSGSLIAGNTSGVNVRMDGSAGQFGVYNSSSFKGGLTYVSGYGTIVSNAGNIFGCGLMMSDGSTAITLYGSPITISGGTSVNGALSVSNTLTVANGITVNAGGLSITGSSSFGAVSMGAALGMGGNNINSVGTLTVSTISGGPSFTGNPTWNNSGTGGSANVAWNGGQLRPVSSSRRYKTDIEDLLIPLDAVYKLVPRKYTRKNDGTTEVGFIAEEALEVGLGDWVTYNDSGDVESFDYYKYVVALQGAVMDLNERLTVLEGRV